MRSVAAHSYELNNLDNEALDAPIYTISQTGNNPNTTNNSNLNNKNINNLDDFTSLPCETFLVACKTEKELSSGDHTFCHKNPIYQSAHVQSDGTNVECLQGVKKVEGKFII